MLQKCFEYHQLILNGDGLECIHLFSHRTSVKSDENFSRFICFNHNMIFKKTRIVFIVIPLTNERLINANSLINYLILLNSVEVSSIVVQTPRHERHFSIHFESSSYEDIIINIEYCKYIDLDY